MTTTSFGAGYLFARRTDITNPTPVYLGITQELQLEFKQEIKKLYGQFKYAVDAAGAAQDITGKVKFARWQTSALNDLLLGGTLTAASGKQISVVSNGLPEEHASGATVTVTHTPTIEDLGVFYKSSGKQLTRVAPAGEATGKYSVNESTGVYTFGGTDVSSPQTLQFFYEYGVTSQQSLLVTNTLMGSTPAFEVHFQQYYINQAGQPNTLNIMFNACRGNSISAPFKNSDFGVLDFGFEVFSDVSGNVFTWNGSE